MTDAGKGVILKSGPASVVLSYLKRKKQLIFNLLCKHSYYVILPSISDTLKIRRAQNFEGGWLEWKHCITSKLRATIEGVAGSYAGECTSNKRIVPNGRGMFETSDKLILGYLTNGRWAEGSHQIVVFKKKKQFRVCFIQKLRSGA